MEEIEYKFMLSSAEFELLLCQNNFKSPITQVNHYFIDSNNILRDNHITVRVRECLNKKYLQIKYDKINNDTKDCSTINNLTIRNEFSHEINSIGDVTPAEIGDVTGVYVNNIINVGNMITYRYKYYLTDDIEVCADKNKYFDVIDYELEIELLQNTLIDVDSILSKLHIEPKLQSHGGKCTRFLRELNLHNNNIFS